MNAIVDPNFICKKIKKKRRAAGYSQEKMAMELGITQATVSKYENGRVPDAATYESWLQVCERSIQAVQEGRALYV
ncbi:helix-turn-helix domain-containing protein [Paenibacillus periandrae]|uniref:helix-turn-helix domain-containing protein n=1 Tax=Paenibacillus periandrae TaxID=1761741 RepID=UPI001F09A0A3